MGQIEMDGMPEPGVLRLATCDGQTVVTCGRFVVYRFEADDLGMRNLAIVALTDAGRPVGEVAALFGLTATYVSMLRGRARAQGSAGLVRRRGRPPRLSERQGEQVRAWAAAGRTHQAIAEHYGVARSVISELLARRGPAPVQGDLTGATEQVTPEQVTPEQVTPEQVTPEQVTPEQVTPEQVAVAGGPVPAPRSPIPAMPAMRASLRIRTGVRRSRYAGAMLLYPYLHMLGAQAILAAMTGGPARRYDDLAVLTTATVGFALGIDTVEGVKHLHRAEAGAALGLVKIPELTTLRSRPGTLADGGDPLALQRAFAAAMLRADPADAPVYFVDDHFVAYAGAQPVAKGWNTKRRHAEPGRDDTLIVDARGRAVLFDSAEPTGLSTTLPGVLTQLRRVLGPNAPVILAFDRGGAYPVTFTACRDAGAHWLTYRRAPLAATTATPAEHPTTRGGKPATVTLADETVELSAYGPARQLSLYQGAKVVLQILTSDTTTTAPDLLSWLRARWRIENFFKYAAEHNGIDSLADYVMDTGPDDRKVANPARAAARKVRAAAEAALASAERDLARLLTGPATVTAKNAALPAAHAQIADATAAVAAAKTALKPVPAKIAVTELDPDATRARPRLERRGLQMVLRLLAYNAEAWLADHFNTYLNDPDEHRAILRHLLHLGGQITYTPHTITVTLDRPDSPRVARALHLLTQELNTKTATMPGDPRPLTYQITAT